MLLLLLLLLLCQGSSAGTDQCYEQNESGQSTGHCGLNFVNKFEACQSRDIYCGLLQCKGGTYNGQPTSFSMQNTIRVTDGDGNEHVCESVTGTSINSMLEDESVLVTEGTPCGSFQVSNCLTHQCMHFPG